MTSSPEKKPKVYTLAEEVAWAREDQKSGMAPRGRIYLHNITAYRTLNQDLGLEQSKPVSTYDLDDETRDRLIAHARQDASLAVIVAASCEKEILRVRSLVIFMIGLLFIVLYLLVRGT